ncbi:hypothetical protein SASPL_156526 [Salvia splendens]|uniref:Pentatricopeptide repeat-containing protein n=1 Tax=Salvia splendens TaxID=180675 RepID=A0A8X8VWK4_SALSN|nr:hypothetical protein SASPL_156526 [Salvia splendens]
MGTERESKLLEELRWTKLESELKRLLRSLKPSQVCAVLRAQSDERNALNFFYWADRQWRYRHYPVVYHDMLRILIELVILSKALQMLNVMQRAGVELDISVCNTAVNVLVEGEKLEKALRFSERMLMLDDAVKLIEEMPLKGCAPDKVSYYTVMGVLCKEKRIDELKGLLKKMLEESKLQPDQVTYNTLIHILCKHGHGDEALGSYGKQRKEGFEMYKHGCKPNCVSYTALLNGLCRDGNSLEAREMMDMSEGWWTPNSVTYSVILHGFRREGKLSDACDIMMEMIRKGFYPSPVDINLLIQSLCRVGKTEQARKLMEECLKKGCAVNVVNYTSVIHGFCQNDDLASALSVFDDMYLNNKHPDAHGRVDDLLKLMDKLLPRQSFKTAYNQIIEKLCCFGHTDEAYKLLGRVLRTASKIDVDTCHILMRTFLRNENPLGSYQVASRMFNRNLVPDLKLCEEVSKKLISQKKLEEADKLMLRFVERGILRLTENRLSIVELQSSAILRYTYWYNDLKEDRPMDREKGELVSVDLIVGILRQFS